MLLKREGLKELYKTMLKENRMTIKCIGCKTKITMDHPNRRLCARCRDERHKQRRLRINTKARKKYIPKSEKIHVCKWCNTVFSSKQEKSKFCSGKCRRSHWGQTVGKETRLKNQILKLQIKLAELQNYNKEKYN